MSRYTIAVLGAADPEMTRIEGMLADAGIPAVHAGVVDPDTRRVRPGEPATCIMRGGRPEPARAALSGHHVLLVEAILDAESDWLGETASAVRVDHHSPGDPGYGRPPAGFFPASSLGQVLDLLHGAGPIRADDILCAAADHCLAAAYRGECPGVQPDELYRWRLRQRAAFQGRPEADIVRDGEQALKAILAAPLIPLGDVVVRDLRGQRVSELPDAQARSGASVLCDGLPGRDSRQKVNLMGSAEACRAFVEMAPALGLVEAYGDPARGIVGAYRGR